MPPRRVVSSRPKTGVLWFLFITAASCAGCSQPEGTEVAAFDYVTAGQHGACETKKSGAAGATDGLKSAEGLSYTVRAPSNYDRTFAHPLLMVYAAGGRSASRNETLTRLTTEATRNGFVVAYAAHRPMSVEVVQSLAKLPGEIASNWCIDLQRVYATGHSDGGTVSTAIALLDATKGTFAGIAPSAAGFSKNDFATFKCPSAPFPVMVMHSKEDMLFRGWGADAAKWWATCNGCDMTKPPQPVGDACVAYQDCAARGSTRYCEGTGSHREWPDLGKEIVSFSQTSASGGLITGDERLEKTSASIGPELRP